MSARQSIEPTYDWQKTGDRFDVETRVDGRRVSMETTRDPFVNTAVTVGWRDLLRGLVRRSLRVTVVVGGDREIVEDVCELDSDYLGTQRSSRRREWNAHIQDSLAKLGDASVPVVSAGTDQP